MRKVISILNTSTMELETFGSVVAAIEKCSFDNIPSRGTFDKYFSRLNQNSFNFKDLKIFKNDLISA